MKRSVLLRATCPYKLYRGAFGAECAGCQLVYIYTPVLVTDDPIDRDQCCSTNYRTQVNSIYFLVIWLTDDVQLLAVKKLVSLGPKNPQETGASSI